MTRGGRSAASAQVPIETLIRGFDEAHARLRPIIDDIEADPGDAFLPLFEALNWSVAVIDLARSQELAITAPHESLRGLRFARNRVRHRWAMALDLAEVPAPPLPVVIFGGRRRGGSVTQMRGRAAPLWVWANAALLPKGLADKNGEAAYIAGLEGREAHLVLAELAEGLTNLR